MPRLDTLFSRKQRNMENSDSAPTISVVVPTHNEMKNVCELHSRIKEAFSSIGISFELIFVDDSTDETPAIISEIIEKESNVTLIRLTRSFGQATAIAAGMDFATGDAVIMMDADLQDPPELIPTFVARWKEGYSVVYASRLSQGGHAYRFLSKRFYRLQSRISNTHIAENAGEFRLIDRRIVNFIKDLPERSRYLRGQTLWPGLKSCAIEIERAERFSGSTKYNLGKSLAVAIEGLISFSIKPLRLAITLAFSLVLIIFALIIVYVVMRTMAPEKFSPGWLSLLIAILGVGALNLFILGVIGEYLGRVFEQVQGRPRYLIEYVRSKS